MIVILFFLLCHFAEVRGFIFDFVKQMRQDFSGQFNAVVTNNPEIAAFVVQL